LDIQVLDPDSCSTLLSSMEIIREFEKGAGYDAVCQSTQRTIGAKRAGRAAGLFG
jgi:hypothetical protein